LGNILKEELSMRKMLLIGAAGTLAALFAANSGAFAANANVPSFSPYQLVDVYGAPPSEPAMGEQRAAFVAPPGTPTVQNSNVPSFSPYAIMPQGH